MNIGRTIRVLRAEPVGDPRPGEWLAVPTEAEAGARPDVTAAGPAATPDPDTTAVVSGPSRE